MFDIGHFSPPFLGNKDWKSEKFHKEPTILFLMILPRMYALSWRPHENQHFKTYIHIHCNILYFVDFCHVIQFKIAKYEMTHDTWHGVTQTFAINILLLNDSYPHLSVINRSSWLEMDKYSFSKNVHCYLRISIQVF